VKNLLILSVFALLIPASYDYMTSNAVIWFTRNNKKFNYLIPYTGVILLILPPLNTIYYL